MADNDVLSTTYAQAREHGGLIDLSGRSKWRLTGADRVRYLNGQVTNDIRRARPEEAMLACVTTAKGRLCGIVFVSAAPDFLRIDSEPELREELTARIERYIISDDAALEDVTNEECLFHLLRAEADLPEQIDGAEIRAANRYGRAGVDIIVPQSRRELALESLAEKYALIPDDLAEAIRIETGVPRWGAELGEETLPPEAGLDRTAIDYSKGCYIGQEVISRIKSIGHVNRQLAGFAASEPLARGMTLHDGADKPAGEITSAAWGFGSGEWIGLGYLKRGFAGGTLNARSGDERKITVRIRDLGTV
jgi:folate-binding protein YgfZ